MSVPQIGDKAPAFRGENQKGEKISLGNFTGRKLVLYFYPKDDTPGCTAQACNLSENYKQLQAQGYKVLGVSPDTAKKHQKFIEKYNLNFDLLADVNKETIQAYGVWVEKSMYGKSYMGVARTTFIIDEKGIILDVIEKVNTKEHTAQIIS
ncbi:MAG TPA: thioredoxin-dependent thiol peroxidase [Bacteroidetes bacterium]|jgi:thioredoxin-dependent peroxiredoxin|nr:thioredoxin-dependent thiol peroxidase [Bacteroidota bacterium]